MKSFSVYLFTQELMIKLNDKGTDKKYLAVHVNG